MAKKVAKKKKARKPTTTFRAICMLERAGWVAGEVERRITWAVKRDLYGFADIVAFKPGTKSLLFLQVTSAQHVQERVDKVAANVHAYQLQQLGHQIEVWGLRDRVVDGSIVKPVRLVVAQQSLSAQPGTIVEGLGW